MSAFYSNWGGFILLVRVASLLNCNKKPAEVSQGGLLRDPIAWGYPVI